MVVKGLQRSLAVQIQQDIFRNLKENFSAGHGNLEVRTWKFGSQDMEIWKSGYENLEIRTWKFRTEYLHTQIKMLPCIHE
jgi:hypothetical protein